MGKQDTPKPAPIPDPVAEDVTDSIAEDLMEERNKDKKGRTASLLTSGQKSSKKSRSLLGNSSNKLG